MDRTDRLYTLVEDLRGAAWRRRTAREPAARYAEVRTTERDVSALPRTEARIPAPAGRTGGRGPDRRIPLPPLNFSLPEVIAIGATPRHVRGVPFEAAGVPGKNMPDMTDESAGAARDLAARGRVIKPIVVQPVVVQAACRAACGAPTARAREVLYRPIPRGERARGGGAAAEVWCRRMASPPWRWGHRTGRPVGSGGRHRARIHVRDASGRRGPAAHTDRPAVGWHPHIRRPPMVKDSSYSYPRRSGASGTARGRGASHLAVPGPR